MSGRSAAEEAVDNPYEPRSALRAWEFMSRYGASCRTKHLIQIPVARRQWPAFAWSLACDRVPLVNRRPFALPARTGLPLEFIRLDPWEASYLYAVASQAAVGIVEIGRYRGGSTFLLACANESVPIWSIDLEPQDDEYLRRLLGNHGVGGNVELLVGNSHETSFPSVGEFDLLFVDGDHLVPAVLADLDRFYPKLAPGGHVLFHDCYGGYPVQQAVLEFISREKTEIVRSPYIPAAHWHTEYGLLAHVRKPAPTAVEREREAPVVDLASRRESRRKLPIALAAALAALALSVLVPEALGDWPYNPIGENTHHAQKHHPPARPAAAGNATIVT